MIYQKLLEFQKQNITITKDATNPHFRSKYATLNEVLDKVKGPLNALGVVIVQTTERDGVRTFLIDTEEPATNCKERSDPWDGGTLVNCNAVVECFVPFIGATDMQKLGGAITYARRYSLVTLLGLEDEDDDGNIASTPKPAPRAVQRPQAATQDPAAQQPEPDRTRKYQDISVEPLADEFANPF